MWTTATRLMSFTGSAMVSLGGASPPAPLRAVLVQPFRFTLDSDGNADFEALGITDRTTDVGDFAFTDVPVAVEVDTVSSSIPPYDTYEITRPDSLPDLAFRLFVESELLTGGVTPAGTDYTDVYDEREAVTPAWVTAHPDRVDVDLTGSPPLSVLVPATEHTLLLTGIPGPPTPVSGREFHFLRIGRAIRQELGEFGDARPDYVGKAGYFTSSNMWIGSPPEPSFFPGVVDAPFGSTLQIGGHLGADFLTPPLADNLYYHVDFARYTGPVNAPFNPASLVDQTPVLDRLFNKKYLLPTVAPPKGQWQTLHLGPFEGSITQVEPPHDPGLVGSSVMVYKRPGLPDPLTEYWPFHDLMVIWNSGAAPNELIVLTVEIYEKVGGTDTAPELKKLAVTSSPNDHLPLLIDNRRAVPKFHAISTGYATFAPETVGALLPLDPCGTVPVTPGQINGNECLVVRYSVEDGSGNPHPHVRHYGLWVEFSRRGTLHSVRLDIWGRGGHPPFGSALGYEDINGSYSPVTPPIWEVNNRESVLLPWLPDGWPPEPAGDPPSPCVAYAAEVSLGCGVRTVNGWNRIFGHPHVSRHIIIER